VMGVIESCACLAYRIYKSIALDSLSLFTVIYDDFLDTVFSCPFFIWKIWTMVISKSDIQTPLVNVCGDIIDSLPFFELGCGN